MVDEVVKRQRAERIEVRRSREQILAAAERYYETHSSDPTTTELAHLAGVGVATLYRRFASIDDVVRALYERTVEYQQAVADEMVDQATGWDAVVAVVSGIATAILEHPAIPRVTRRMIELEPTLRHGAQWDAGLKEMARRAIAEGTLRPDVDANDITLAAFRIGEYGYLPAAARPRIVARQIGLLLDGLRADSAHATLPGEGISTEEIQTFYRHPYPPPR